MGIQLPVGGFLPLSGGTLTGALIGTTVTLSGAASAGLLRAGIATNSTGDIYVGDNSIASLYMDGAGGTRGAIYLRNSGGTQAARTASPDNSTVGNIECFPYTPTGGYWPGASMDFVIDGAVTDGQAPPTRIDFFVNAANGSTTKAVSFLSDKSAQFLGSVGFTATNTLDIGTSATVLAPRTVYAGTSFVGPIVTATTRVTTPAVGNSGGGGLYLQAQGSSNYFAVDNWVSGGSLTARALGIFGWMPGADPDATGPDTAFSRVSSGVIGVGTGAQGSTAGTLQLATLTASATIATGAPAGASSGLWKLGSLVTGAAVLDTTRSIFVDIGGTVYKLMVAQ